MSAYSASAPVTHSTTKPSATKAMPGSTKRKRSAWCGLSAPITDGFCAMCTMPSAAMTTNHTAVTGPKNWPMPPVPCRCTTNSAVSTTSETGTM